MPLNELDQRICHRGVPWASMIICLLANFLCNAAYAEKCSADAEFQHAYPANNTPSKFKFKFRISSDNCEQYSCTGYVHYTIHFQYSDGASNSHSSLVHYRIPNGQRSIEITDETYPSGLTKISVRDVEIGEVTCSSP